jgi:hypothetical protein
MGGQIFDWCLEINNFKKSIFEKKKCVEYVNPAKVYGFIKNNMGINYSGTEKHKLLSCKNELEWMTKYKSLYDMRTKQFRITYHLPKYKFGRVYPERLLSLSFAHRPTRHSLSEDYYIDIDMVNCSITVVNEICRHHDIVNPNLNYYVDNREAVLNEIMTIHNVTRDIAKKLPIRLMFGGTYNSWLKENNVTNETKINVITNIENEMKPVIETVYANNKTIEKFVIKEEPDKWDTIDKKKKGVMALWSMSIERLLQETAILYLVENKNVFIEDVVSCQDGFMILKKYYYDGLIEDIEKVIFEKFNMGLKFKAKPFDEKYEIPLHTEDKSYKDWEDSISSKCLADRFVEEFSQYVCFGKDEEKQFFYVFRGDKKIDTIVIGSKNIKYFLPEMTNSRWYRENKDSFHNLTLYLSEDLFNNVHMDLANAIELSDEEYERLREKLRYNTSKDMRTILHHALPKLRVSPEPFNSNPFIIGFENGVFDLLNNSFRKYEYTDYITMSTGYDYEEPNYGIDINGDDILNTYPEEMHEKIRHNRFLKEELVNIIESIIPDKGERTLYLQMLSSGIDGKQYQNLFLLSGQGGNGKSMMNSLIKASMGNYCETGSNGLLKDVERANGPSPEMLKLKNSRYIIFSETGGDVKLAILRKLTGGGGMSARDLNSKVEKFTLKSTIVMEFNNAPDLSGGKPELADYRRMIYIQFPVNFTEDPNKIDKVIGGIQYKKANRRYQQPEYHQEVKHVFFDLLRGIYQEYRNKKDWTVGMMFDIPESVRLRSEKFLQDQDVFSRAFNNSWELVDIKKNNDGTIDKTDKKSKTFKFKEVWESIENSNEYKSLKTVRERREYSRDEFKNWIDKKCVVEYDSDKGCNVVLGIRRKYAEEDGEILNIKFS